MLILTHLGDWSALRLAALVRAGGGHCDIVTVESLSFARRRTHRVSDTGTSTTIELQDGTTFRDADLGGVLNRCSLPPDLAWRSAPPVERHYASAELNAFMMSWLHGLRGPVRNRPVDDSLAGPCPSPLRAALAAAEAGLPVCNEGEADANPAVADRVQVVMLDGEPFGGGASPDVVAAARNMLARLDALESLVGLDFVVDANREWRFASLTPLPVLPATPAFVIAVERLLSQPTMARESVRS